MDNSERVTSTVVEVVEPPGLEEESAGRSAVEATMVLTATSTTRNVAKIANESNRFSDTRAPF
jgi:hypothetical protein